MDPTLIARPDCKVLNKICVKQNSVCCRSSDRHVSIAATIVAFIETFFLNGNVGIFVLLHIQQESNNLPAQCDHGVNLPVYFSGQCFLLA